MVANKGRQRPPKLDHARNCPASREALLLRGSSDNQFDPRLRRPQRTPPTSDAPWRSSQEPRRSTPDETCNPLDQPCDLSSRAALRTLAQTQPLQSLLQLATVWPLAGRVEERIHPSEVADYNFSHTETCFSLSAVSSERSQPAQRYLRAIPAIRAIRSISAGHAYRNGIR